MMEWQFVQSTDIAAVGYDPDTRQLAVEFKRSPGKVYYYADVPSMVYADFLAAHSPGKYFHANIKGKYAFTTHEEVSR